MIIPVTYINYELNKAFIIRNFCINKNRPALHCNGKCYLAKKIKAAQENDEKQAKVNTIKFLYELFHEYESGSPHYAYK